MATQSMGQVDINDYIDASKPIELIIENKNDSISILNTPKIKLISTDDLLAVRLS